MKNKTQPQITQAIAFLEMRGPLMARLASAAVVLMTLSASAGTFTADFNSGQPAATSIYGNAHILSSGGFTNSGCLQLATNLTAQNGSFVISNFDGGLPTVAFTARFKALIGGGTGADGMVFAFANNLPAGTFGAGIPDESAGTGLMVEFDTFSNANDVVGISLWSGGGKLQDQPFTGLRVGAFVDAVVQLNPDGSLLVIYDGFYAYTNASPGIGQISEGQFGFGARCGGLADNHLIDNLTITTYTNGLAFVKYYSPIGRSARADAPIDVVLSDALDPFTALPSQVDTNKITLTLDGAQVNPSITQSAPQGTTLTDVHYPLPTIFASGSSHTASVMYADQSLPPVTNTWQWTFTVGTYAVLPTNLVANPALVSGTAGFALRTSQIDAHLGQTVARAELQLAQLLIDPNTGLPYTNHATITSTNEPTVINYSTAGAQGDFPTEPPLSIPGLPGLYPDGITSSGDTNAAMDVVTYLHLNANSIYTLGVSSSDGFRLTAASAPDVFATQEAIADGVRVAADTTVTFAVAQTGYYPFRICYFVGGLEAVNPTSDNPSLEFFSVDAAGAKTLINDTNTDGYIPAFVPAQTLPYIRSIGPTPGSTGVPRGSSIDATLVDGSITVQTNTIQLLLDGLAVTPVISSNAGITTIHFPPASLFNPNTTHTNQLAFTDSTSTRRTNTWTFTVENILSQLWVIPPNSATNATWAKWVTSGSTERGLAYNPKTGHVLLVSRSGISGGPAGTGGIGILDGNSGAFLGTMDVSLSAASGVGTFRLNMIDVADDGVIFACNLATSGSQNFQIYRWQNEGAPQTLVFNGAPTGAGTPRWGDDFVVRGSGAGTQILASGNNGSVNSVPIFSTVDGTNFTVTLTVPASLPNNSVRLGIAWGCGNTFYGETTGSGNPLRYVTFNGPLSTVASLTASYTILDFSSIQSIGPIGVDIPNQRLIGDATSGATGSTHSMNLFDLNTLSTSGNNLPIDHKTFATSTGSFGTGAVDFSPDGSRVYTLDTGNGIIAFSLAPKLAAPSICSQPINFFVNPTNSVGFLDVMAIGSPQGFQWRFHGLNPANAAVPVLNATNRTLDTYNIQQSNLGWYTVLITNSLGSVTSSVALLDIQMVITNQPAAIAVTQGSPATFSVGVAGGAQPLSYQWRKNGVNIGNATASSYTIPSADFTDAAYLGYSVLITDALTQAVTSASATLNVEPGIGSAPGSGTGLLGMYYTNAAYTTTTPPAPFTGFPVTNRVDATVNFDFGNGSFDNVSFPYSTDYFQVRWVGQIQPLYSQAYTFFTTSDDGQRLWVNGTKLVDDWTTHGGTERTAPLAGALTAGQKYDVVYEMYEKTGGSMAKLWWWSPSQIKTNIPMEQLYPGSGPLVPSFTTSISNGTNLVMNWVGTCVLQSATNVTGPWLPLTTNAGPFTVNVTTSPQHFYRLLSQQF